MKLRGGILTAAMCLGLFLISFYLAAIYLDPDFGWRIRIGEYIVQNGIPATDPYSYTMPSFRFVDHEWLTHVAMYIVYERGGYTLLAVLFAATLVMTVILATRQYKGIWRYGHLMLISSVLLHYFGIKPQVMVWLLSAILITIIRSDKWRTRWKYAMPLFFLIWANLHAGFVYGLGIYALKTIADIKNKRGRTATLLLFAGTVAATFVNPYGWRIWEEIARTGSDARLRIYVMEWMPQFVHIGLSSFIIIGWYLTLIIKYWKHMTYFERAVASIGFLFGMTSTRNFPLWIITISPIVARLLGLLIHEAHKNAIARSRIKKVSIVFIVFLTGVLLFELVFITREQRSYTEDSRYPKAAIRYLKNHPSTGNILAAYEWGGYFIWKYPGKKVFIDGRMPSWRQNPKEHPEESPDALDEFTGFLTQKKPLAPLLKKYRITTVLLPKQYFEKGKSVRTYTATYKLKTALEKNGLKAVYTDNIAILYQ